MFFILSHVIIILDMEPIDFKNELGPINKKRKMLSLSLVFKLEN